MGLICVTEKNRSLLNETTTTFCGSPKFVDQEPSSRHHGCLWDFGNPSRRSIPRTYYLGLWLKIMEIDSPTLYCTILISNIIRKIGLPFPLSFKITLIQWMTFCTINSWSLLVSASWESKAQLWTPGLVFRMCRINCIHILNTKPHFS